jgi:hypothetical protein
LDLLEPVDRDAAFYENSVDLGDDVAGRSGGQRDPEPLGAHLDASPDIGAI